MDITFTCNNCKQDLQIDEAGVGMTVECPKCNASLIVPPVSTSKPANIKDTVVLSPFPQAPQRQPPVSSGKAATYSLPTHSSSSQPHHAPPPPPQPPQTVRAIVTDFDISVGDMTKHCLKWTVALLPAFAILVVVGWLIVRLFGKLFH